MNIDFWWLNFVHSIESIKPKRFISLFHHPSIPHCHIKPSLIPSIPFYMHAYLALSLTLGLLMNARTHNRSHSLSLSIFVICLCSSLVTFDVDMLRQSHQLPFTQSDYNICRTLVCVRLFYIFPPFCSNHNHFGEIECILYSLRFSFTRSLTQPLCVAPYFFT